MIAVRPLADEELPLVDARLPLHRLGREAEGDALYLIAWDDLEPVGHARLALHGHGGLPEIQDVWVLPERRREGIGTLLTLAAEREAAKRGFDRVGLTVGVGNDPALCLYGRCGYAEAGKAPFRVSGTIVLRGEEHEVNDVLIWLVKDLPPA